MAGPCRFTVPRSLLFTLSSWKLICVCSDTVLSCAWVLLLVAGTSCQVMTELVRRAAFNKKERRRKEVYESNLRRFVKKRYTPFPTMSLFKQLRVSMRKRTDQHPIKVVAGIHLCGANLKAKKKQ